MSEETLSPNNQVGGLNNLEPLPDLLVRGSEDLPAIPNIAGIFAGTNEAWKKAHDFEEGLHEKVNAYKEQLFSENADQIQTLIQSWIDIKDTAVNTAREAIMTYAKDVWEGKAGNGVLLVIGQGRFSAPEEEPYYRLARVVDVTPDSQHIGELEQSRCIHLTDSRWLKGRFDQRYVSLLSYQRPQYSIPQTSEDLERWKVELVEVNPDNQTEEELRELYMKVKKWGEVPDFLTYTMHPTDQIRLFGPLATFEPGESYEVARFNPCTRQGESWATIVYLPTGKWAVVAHCEEPKKTWCNYIVIDPDVSVSNLDGWHNFTFIDGEKESPSEEEREYLNKMHPEIDCISKE